MLVKQVSKKGDAVPYEPAEVLATAIAYGVKTQNTSEKIFWVLGGSITKGTFDSLNKSIDKSWHATATGTAKIGFTETKTDQFHEPRLYNFKVKYSSAKDSLGLPDIKIDEFEMEPIERNPAVLMNFPDMTYKAPVAEEIKAPAKAAAAAAPSAKV